LQHDDCLPILKLYVFDFENASPALKAAPATGAPFILVFFGEEVLGADASSGWTHKTPPDVILTRRLLKFTHNLNKKRRQ
jgi:hypothetical protein